MAQINQLQGSYKVIITDEEGRYKPNEVFKSYQEVMIDETNKTVSYHLLKDPNNKNKLENGEKAVTTVILSTKSGQYVGQKANGVLFYAWPDMKKNVTSFTDAQCVKDFKSCIAELRNRWTSNTTEDK